MATKKGTSFHSSTIQMTFVMVALVGGLLSFSLLLFNEPTFGRVTSFVGIAILGCAAWAMTETTCIMEQWKNQGSKLSVTKSTRKAA